MPCEGCLDTFVGAPTDKSRAETIDREQPNCCCEECVVSPYCDAPVGSNEALVRIVMDPDHLEEEDGALRLKSSFFSDAASFGSSSLRKERATPDEYVKTVELIIGKKPTTEAGQPRKVYGIVSLPAAVIREFKHEAVQASRDKPAIPEMQAFGIYATGEENRPNHAEVMTNGLNQHTRSKALKAGKNLTKAAQQSFVAVADFDACDLTGWAA